MQLNAWITLLNPTPNARCRLFCLPYAGGGASFFRTWPAALPGQIEVCSIQLPGRENRFPEPRYTAIEPLVQTLAPLMLPHLGADFALFGYSMGGLIAFELLRELRRLGAPEPRRLFIAARPAPHMVEQRPPLHQMPADRLFEELDRRYGGIPSEALKNREIRDVFVPLLRADIQMIETYRYAADAPLACPISVFGGTADRITGDELSAWQAHTSQPLDLRMFEGSHFFIQDARCELLALVGRQLTPA